MSAEELADKVHFVKAWVGSREWVHTIQEGILDNRSICFACGGEVTFRLDFLYMRGRIGVVMVHDGCFILPAVVAVERLGRDSPPLNLATELPPGEWLSLVEAANFMGITYGALYQRIWSSGTLSELVTAKLDGKWFVSRQSVEFVGRGRLVPGRTYRVGNSRMWRSEVTEQVDRISAGEAARKIGVSRSWVLSRKDQFDAIKISGQWRLSASLIEDYIRGEEAVAQ